jgi:hypothetical protein
VMAIWSSLTGIIMENSIGNAPNVLRRIVNSRKPIALSEMLWLYISRTISGPLCTSP